MLNKNKFASEHAQYQLLLNEFLSAEHELSDLRQILHSAPDAILITNPEIEIIYVNPAWERLTGYTFSEVQNKNPKLLQSGKTPRKIYQKLWKQLKQNQPFTHDSLIEKRKDGSEFVAHSTTFPVLRFNRPNYYVQFLYDITSKKQAENERQELLSFVSHELKTPITVLKLLISSKVKSKKEVTPRDLDLISRELDRLTELINESLDISRIDANRLNLNLSYFDLNQLIEEVFDQISLVLDHHTINVESVPNLILIADYNRIKQVLINFLTNAIKYSKPGTKIELKAAKKQNQVVVSVKDEGMGISKDRLKFIFNKFFQVKKQGTEGLGLGLFISSEIIKNHRGKIWAESEINKGSTFYFSLALKK